MMQITSKYCVGTVNLEGIRNRNEVRVVSCMRETIEALGNPALPEQSIRDIYALALNQLAARYVQTGSIVLREPVRNNEIQSVVTSAFEQVLRHPKE